jgi:hypothetical protein
MYSVTQGSNIAVFIAVLTLLVKKLNWDLTQEDITTIVAAVVALIAIVTSFVNRYKKGDVTIAGFKSPMV